MGELEVGDVISFDTGNQLKCKVWDIIIGVHEDSVTSQTLKLMDKRTLEEVEIPQDWVVVETWRPWNFPSLITKLDDLEKMAFLYEQRSRSGDSQCL